MLKNCPRCTVPLRLQRISVEDTINVLAMFGVIKRAFVDLLSCPRCGYPE